MKRTVIIVMCSIGVLFGHNRAYAQVDETAQLLLNIEKLTQFKNILEDMKKGYDILYKGYGTVKDISEGNFSIHKTFLDGLMEVSPDVRHYRKVGGIISNQVILVREYRKAFDRFRSNGLFRTDELLYLEKVYGRLFRESLRSLDELAMVITSHQMRMSDDERLRAIDRIFDDMEDRLMFLRAFNNETSQLSLQREKAKAQLEYTKKLHSIND